MTVSALTLEQTHVALARCSDKEGAILAELEPHECALVLEAKFFADAAIRDTPTKEQT